VSASEQFLDTLGGGRYEVRGALGRGSSGEVLHVFDRDRRRDVALKRLLSAEPEEGYRLKLEFRALADARHPNLVELYDLWVDAGTSFYTMELVRGVDLVTYAAGGDRTRSEHVVVVLPQLVAGLRALHAAGILHRDLKPQNVLVESRGSPAAADHVHGSHPRLVLLDFGLLACLTPDERDAAGQRELAGSAAYAAPEQLWSGSFSEASDWYAAAVLLYEALSGSLPYDGSLAAIASAKRKRRPPRLGAGAAPEWLADLLDRLLAPSPAERPATEEILDVLSRAGADVG